MADQEVRVSKVGTKVGWSPQKPPPVEQHEDSDDDDDEVKEVGDSQRVYVRFLGT